MVAGEVWLEGLEPVLWVQVGKVHQLRQATGVDQLQSINHSRHGRTCTVTIQQTLAAAPEIQPVERSQACAGLNEQQLSIAYCNASATSD
jgi:hypothetical protein